MSEVSDRVKRRRIKRKLKAAASVVLALSAGAFLACQRGVSEVARVVDAARGNDGDSQGDPSNASGDATSNDKTAGGAIEVHDASGALMESPASQSLDAGNKADALARRRSGGTKDAAVDVNEHRKGMPVPDNLLE